jgi:predicted transcriptional regulator
MHQYTFPQICVEILISLSQSPKTPEAVVTEINRTMAALLTSLEELMIDNYCYKMPDDTFTLSKMGRDLIQEINEITTDGEDAFGMRW